MLDGGEMEASDEQACYVAEGGARARRRHCVIAGCVTVAACLLVYTGGSFLVRRGFAQNFIIAALEIPFYIIAFFIVLSTVFKKMEYTFSPAALLVHYGRKGYAIPYEQIRQVERLSRGQFFCDRPRGAENRARLLPSRDPEARSFLFGPYHSIQFGAVFLCATQAENYLLLEFKENVPRMLIAPERLEEFLRQLTLRREQARGAKEANDL